jgi:cysteine-rich PDZ-binding protein
MPCKKCESKLSKLPTPEVWKSGSRAVKPGEGSSRGGQNKLLASSSSKTSSALKRANPYGKKCKECKCSVNIERAMYCQSCAYRKGICALCGVKILDTSSYRMSSV